MINNCVALCKGGCILVKNNSEPFCFWWQKYGGEVKNSKTSALPTWMGDEKKSHGLFVVAQQEFCCLQLQNK